MHGLGLRVLAFWVINLTLQSGQNDTCHAREEMKSVWLSIPVSNRGQPGTSKKPAYRKWCYHWYYRSDGQSFILSSQNPFILKNSKPYMLLTASFSCGKIFFMYTENQLWEWVSSICSEPPQKTASPDLGLSQSWRKRVSCPFNRGLICRNGPLNLFWAGM